jgi:GTP cyclohydrolase II
VVERVPCRPRTSHHSKSYLRTKKEKMGHFLSGL